MLMKEFVAKYPNPTQVQLIADNADKEVREVLRDLLYPVVTSPTTAVALFTISGDFLYADILEFAYQTYVRMEGFRYTVPRLEAVIIAMDDGLEIHTGRMAETMEDIQAELARHQTDWQHATKVLKMTDPDSWMYHEYYDINTQAQQLVLLDLAASALLQLVTMDRQSYNWKILYQIVTIYSQFGGLMDSLSGNTGAQETDPGKYFQEMAEILAQILRPRYFPKESVHA